MELTFSGTVVEWRGPAPHQFVRMPEDLADDIADVAGAVSYGWGCIPVRCTTGSTTWTTSLFPKDGSYLVPVKLDVRRREGIDVGSTIELTVVVDV